MKKSIKIDYEIIDGRLHLEFKSGDGVRIPYGELISVMSSSLSMSIRMMSKNGSQSEGEVFRDVIRYLESEFVNPDSYKDLKVDSEIITPPGNN
jgi:hypothetical protein